MGGCKCSYQNCRVRSDKKTHFYHYPVFDKVRCHQWLSNARKLEYLNLKVSQLKNRVVCEHHFRDDMFMNELRVKLRCDAVPTEDGPYNTSVDMVEPCYLPDKHPIVGVEDIEQVVLQNSSDKKAVFSHKYGDFLTNLDIMDMADTSYVYKVPNVRTTAGTSNILEAPSGERFNIEYEVPIVYDKDITLQTEKNIYNQSQTKPVKRVKTLKPVVVADKDARELTIEMINVPKEHNADINKPLYNNVVSKPVYNYVIQQNTETNSESYMNPYDNTLGSMKPQSPKVKILSEKRIDDLNKVKTCVITNNIKLDDNNIINQRPTTTQIIDNQHYNIIKTSPTKSNTLSKSDKDSKRLFTKKLRDVIKTSIDRMDDNIVLPPKPPEMKIPVPPDNVMSHLSTDPNLPSLDKYTISYLESRLNRMENLLLYKINDNSKKITELKNLIHNQIDSGKHKDSEGEKDKNPEYYKKKLYQEISQFLPTDVNSMIYEQLFLNKFEKKNSDIDFIPSNSKRKRTRKSRGDNEV